MAPDLLSPGRKTGGGQASVRRHESHGMLKQGGQTEGLVARQVQRPQVAWARLEEVGT